MSHVLTPQQAEQTISRFIRMVEIERQQRACRHSWSDIDTCEWCGVTV